MRSVSERVAIVVDDHSNHSTHKKDRDIKDRTPPRIVEKVQSSSFDYDSIPIGHYDSILHSGSGIRRLWHLSKFERVLDYLPIAQPNVGVRRKILDIGCFAGSFLSLVDQNRFGHQLGIDILPAQVKYANDKYQTPFRRFRHVESITHLKNIHERFDCVTLIEVIEHLSPEEIGTLFGHLARILVPGGTLMITTPNYASAWPALEQVLNCVGDVNYEEQHITRFNFFNLERKLSEIHPDLTEQFTLALKTTSHLITPFFAGLSFRLAHRLSRAVPHARWRFPFGNLVLAALTRRS